MNFSSLYQLKQYHRIIICWSCCDKDEDYLILCLSLYAIGRKKAAVALLHARIQVMPSATTKVTFLKHLEAISGCQKYSIEIKYWEKVSGVDIKVENIDLPECNLVCLSLQIQKFKEAGAKIQPGSYAESCLQGKRKVQEIQVCKDFASIIFEMVAGAVPFDDFAATPKHIREWADKIAKGLRRVAIQRDGDLFEQVDTVRNLVHLTAFYYMFNDAAMTVSHCDIALSCITDLQNREEAEFDLDGILEYEVQTVAFMAIDFADTKTSNEQLRCYLEAILRKPNRASGKSFTTTVFKNEYAKLPLRESKLFSSCGHVNRVRATKQATPVTLRLDGETHKGIVLNRSDCFEAARNYVVAAATDASDDPEVVRKYDQAMWCLIIGGGADIVVLKFFLKLRGFHEKNLFFAYGEPRLSSNQKPSMIWPDYSNQFEVLEVISKIYEELGNEFNCNRLSPTIVDLHGKLYVATTFLPTQHEFTLFGARIKPTQDGQIKFTSQALKECVKDSRQLVVLWHDCYLECHKEMPIELEKFYQAEVMASLTESEHSVG